MSTSTKKKIVYPRIMRHGNRGVIVKFTALRHGTVIGEGNSGDAFAIGYHSTTWYMGGFNDYIPDIVKANE